jgi:hypothetical protein
MARPWRVGEGVRVEGKTKNMKFFQTWKPQKSSHSHRDDRHQGLVRDDHGHTVSEV